MKRVSILFTLSAILIFFIIGCSQKKAPVCKPKKDGEINYTSAAWHKASMRSYKVLGRRYHPKSVDIGDTMRGISSWYGPDFHGKCTSNGEAFNMNAYTAAHKTWPMDTKVRVNNLSNGKSVIVRVNDRGPFVRGRIIDCSYVAGKKLGLDKTGIAKVSIEAIGRYGT